MAAGVLSLVLDAMQQFPEAESMQYRACRALLTLAGSNTTCDRIVSEGGMGAILAAMLNCAWSAQVQYHGSWALANLIAEQEHIQEFARQEGAIEVCEAAVACFGDHSGIQEKGGQVLHLLV